jgi:cell division protein FtsI/penicillin-binding protein 2
MATMTTKRTFALGAMLLVSLMSFGQLPTRAGFSQTTKSKAASQPASTQTKKPSSPKPKTVSRSRSSRRRASRRLARLNAELQKAAQAAIARDDLRGEDAQVRAAALSALGNQAGSVVVMDPQTGRVYSMVNQEWALGKGCTPCSTIKPYIALAGLKEGLIEKNVPIAAGSALSVSLINAMAYSDNLYFQRIGIRLGLEKIRQYATMFGLGQSTGINLPGEIAGRLPQASDVQKHGVGYAASHGEGFEITPLQLAVFTAALANGGFIFEPRIPRNDSNTEGDGDGNGTAVSAPLEPVLRKQIEITENERINILAGMVGTVEFGTGRQSYVPGVQVIGKTGTCRGDDVLRWGLFTSFASLERPAIVVVVTTNGIGQSGSAAAQIAGKIYDQLADRFNLRKQPSQWKVANSQ